MSSSDGTIEGRFALFCDYALTSADGKLSIVGEFDQIYSTQGKPVLNRGFVVGSFRGEPNAKAEITALLVDDKNKNILPEQTFHVTFGSSGVTNIIIEIAGLAFEASGIYKALFLHNQKTLSEAPIKVMEGKGNVRRGSTSIN